MVALRFLLLSSLLLLADPVHACGWWGDGEMNRDSGDVITRDGRPLEQSLSLESMKLPDQMGYGVAVPEPGRAIPYLLVTYGQPVGRINELKVFGFRSVVDLGSAGQTARLHRSETEAAGMLYFNVPIEEDLPNREQAGFFYRTVVDAGNGPLLVFAARAELVAAMWASYRMRLGAPMEFVIREGRALGLTEGQETELRNRRRR